MPLHLVTGRANAGKTGELNARVLASLGRGESPVLLLPNIADVRRAEGEYAAKVPVGVKVSTFQRWADELWQLHGDGRRIIGVASRDSFVNRAIAEVDSFALAPVSTTHGFSAVVSRIVRTMMEDADHHSMNSEVGRGVARICNCYRRLINEGGLIEAAEAWLALGEASPAVGGTIAVNRFGAFDAPTLALTKGLARSNEVIVAVTWEDGFAPTRSLDATAQELGAAAQTSHHASEPAWESELMQLVSHLYAGPARLQGAGMVRMGLASGAEAESFIAARFASEAVGSGIAPDRIAIAFPRLDSVGHGLETALSAEGLSCDIDIARAASATPLGRTMDGLLELALGVGDRSTAMGVLLGPHSDVGSERVVELDRTWRRFRVSDPRRLLADIVNIDGSLLGGAAAEIRSLARLRLDAVNGRKWQGTINRLMSAGGARLGKGEPASLARTSESLEDDASAGRAIIQAIAEMASVEGNPFSAADLRSVLRTIVTGGTGGEIPGRVQVTEVSRLRSRRFDVVILGGLTAVEMPASKNDSLSDELIAEIVHGPPDDEGANARFAFYMAASRAREQLVLVRREIDDCGAPVRPSVLWEEVVDAYRTPGESADGWPMAGPPLVRVTAADTATSAPQFTSGRRELREDAVNGRCGSGSPPRGQLCDAAVLEQLASIDVFSATEIEAYLHCPYRWFYERVVRPGEIDVEVDARAVGTLAHVLLKAFYEAVPNALGAARVTPDNVEEASRLLGRVVTDAAPEVAAEGLAEELDIARAKRWVATAVRDDASLLPGFEPVKHELAFGRPGEVSVCLGSAKFHGRIDRVDRSNEAVFVTDYKSSAFVSGHEKFGPEGKVQAVVYAQAAGEAFGLPVAGSVYRSLRSRQLRGFWRPDLLGERLALGRENDAIGEERFAELLQETGDRIDKAVAGIRDGRVPRTPADKHACGFCALRAQCEGAEL